MRKRGADVDPQASQRVKFFQLTDLFLASPLVPAYTAAAFIKRFARLSLRTSPAGMPSSPPSLPSSHPFFSFLSLRIEAHIGIVPVLLQCPHFLHSSAASPGRHSCRVDGRAGASVNITMRRVGSKAVPRSSTVQREVGRDSHNFLFSVFFYFPFAIIWNLCFAGPYAAPANLDW